MSIDFLKLCKEKDIQVICIFLLRVRAVWNIYKLAKTSLIKKIENKRDFIMNIDDHKSSIWDANIKLEADGGFDMRNLKIRVFFASKIFSKFGLIWSNLGYFYSCEEKLLPKKRTLQISTETEKRKKLR